MWGCFLMSGVKILHFLKDWWKSIPIHQNYTMALSSYCSIYSLLFLQTIFYITFKLCGIHLVKYKETSKLSKLITFFIFDVIFQLQAIVKYGAILTTWPLDRKKYNFQGDVTTPWSSTASTLAASTSGQTSRSETPLDKISYSQVTGLGGLWTCLFSWSGTSKSESTALTSPTTCLTLEKIFPSSGTFHSVVRTPIWTWIFYCIRHVGLV